MQTNRPETELLLCCSRTHIDAETFERTKTMVCESIDWNIFLQAAIRHRVVPLVYTSLKKNIPKIVPDGVAEKLRGYYLNNTARNLFLMAKLQGILDVFKHNDILAVPFKGPVLAETVFGDIAFRQFNDLDILVSEKDVFKAHSLLVAEGFLPEICLDKERFEKYVRHEDNVQYVDCNGQIMVELHWEMTGRYTTFPFNIDLFRGRLKTVKISGKNIYTIPSEELLLYLCIHGTKDQWESLDAVSCVAELIHSDSTIDWEYTLSLARKMRCVKMFYLGLFMATDLFHLNLPGKIKKMIEVHSQIRIVAEKVCVKLFQSDTNVFETGIQQRFSFFHLIMRDNLLDKIRYFFNLLVIPTKEDWKRYKLPLTLSFIYYVLRPARLCLQATNRLHIRGK